MIHAANVVATSDMVITGDDATNVELEVAGTVDMTKATFTGPDFTFADITKVTMAKDAVLNLTAAQVMAIGSSDENVDGIADNWTALAGAKLNIIDVDGTFDVDLNRIQAAGIDIGTLTLKDNMDNVDSPIILNAGLTLGGADSILSLIHI